MGLLPKHWVPAFYSPLCQISLFPLTKEEKTSSKSSQRSSLVNDTAGSGPDSDFLSESWRGCWVHSAYVSNLLDCDWVLITTHDSWHVDWNQVLLSYNVKRRGGCKIHGAGWCFFRLWHSRTLGISSIPKCASVLLHTQNMDLDRKSQHARRLIQQPYYNATAWV